MLKDRRGGVVDLAADRARFDLPLLLCITALTGIGLACIYSATHNAESASVRGLFRTQFLWVAIGFVLFGVVASLPSRAYYGFAYLVYGSSILLLLYLEATGGYVSKGAARWIHIGGFRLQPSEYAKIGLMLGLARYLSAKPVGLSRPSSLLIPGALIAIPFLLVLKQPDLGTAMIMALMTLPMFYWSGMPMLEVFFLVSPFLSIILSFHVLPWGAYFFILLAVLYFSRPSLFLAVVVLISNILTGGATAIGWNLLQDYQKSRILTFVDPSRDPFGAGYQTIQSKVAIGSGKFWGKGFMQGTQTKLSFLPEQHTDFIFSVLGEQFGLIGALVLFFLFFFLIYRGFSVVRESKNHFLNLIAVGATSILGFHIFTNLAMTMGIMPVAGIPLPFLSYGGSFLSTCMILAGLIAFARRRRLEL